MARYRDSLCRLCRREGEKLFLKGDRCQTEKCAVERRKYPPGQHGQRRRGKPSDYAIQLREKQKVRTTYGLMEKQFKRYFKMANHKRGITGEVLLQILESRLDNILYRMGFAVNRRQARQLVSHRFVAVNGRTVNVASYLVKPGDEVVIREHGRKLKVIVDNLSKSVHRGIPEWVELDSAKFTGKVLRVPARDEIPITAQEQLIVELYSK